MRRTATVLVTAAIALAAPASHANERGDFRLDVLVGGVLRPEYAGQHATYVEAVRGQEYTLRITNPLGVRVAVALAVDGLNTIDARHTDATSAAKWVLAPYESAEISGWQVSGSEARAFVFTGEKHSYGAWLGETANLGVIEAVFYRERQRTVPVVGSLAPGSREHSDIRGELGSANAPAPEAGGRLESKRADAPSPSDDLAATGIGDRQRHEVEWVSLELERRPAATVRLRYEFRPQLERLGLLPPLSLPDPLERREHASGFTGRYCPQPPGH